VRAAMTRAFYIAAALAVAAAFASALALGGCRTRPYQESDIEPGPPDAAIDLRIHLPDLTPPPPDLRHPRCGDGIVDPGEACDDGNAIDTDGCSNICRAPACGDGTVQGGEQCDDGNLDNGDGCEDDCFETSVCGDNDVQGHETCDDGNLIDGDGCDSDCRLPCPDNICKCLGAAKSFNVVSGKLGVANGKISGGGAPTEFYPTEIEGSVCGGAWNATSG